MLTRRASGRRSTTPNVKCVSHVRLDLLVTSSRWERAESVDGPELACPRRAVSLGSTPSQRGLGACVFPPLHDDELYVVLSTTSEAVRHDEVLSVPVGLFGEERLCDERSADPHLSLQGRTCGRTPRCFLRVPLAEDEDTSSLSAPLVAAPSAGSLCYIARNARHVMVADDLSDEEHSGHVRRGVSHPDGAKSRRPVLERTFSQPLTIRGDGSVCSASVAMDPGGRLLARLVAANTSSWPTTLEVWDIWSGSLMFSINQASLSSLVTKRMMRSGSALASKQLLLCRYSKCAFSPDAKHLLVLVYSSVLPAVGEECSCFILNIQENAQAYDSPAQAATPFTVHWLKTLTTRGDSTTTVQHLACAFHPRYSSEPAGDPNVTNRIAVVSFLRQQSLFAPSSSWKRVLVHDMSRNSSVWEWSRPCTSRVNTRLFDVTFSQDGLLLALSVGVHTVELFSASDGHLLRILEAQFSVGTSLHSISISPTGRSIAAMASKVELYLWVGHVAPLRYLALLAVRRCCAAKCDSSDLDSTVDRLLQNCKPIG